MGLFNPVSILKVRVDFSKCTNCEDCLKVCPARIERLEDIESCTDCTRCGKCIESCGSEAIKISASLKH